MATGPGHDPGCSLRKPRAAGGCPSGSWSPSRYGDTTEFRLALRPRPAIRVAVKSTPAPITPTPRPSRTVFQGGGGHPRAATATIGQPRRIATAAGRPARTASPEPRLPQGMLVTRPPRCARDLCNAVRPANRDIPREPDGSLGEFGDSRMASRSPEPTDYWLVNLPQKPMGIWSDWRRFVRIEHDYRETQDRLGLDHLKAATISGGPPRDTHALAQAFCTQLRYDPKALPA